MTKFPPIDPQRLAGAGVPGRLDERLLAGFIGTLHAPSPDALRAAMVTRGLTPHAVAERFRQHVPMTIDLEAPDDAAQDLAGRCGLRLDLLRVIAEDRVGFAADGAREPAITPEEVEFDRLLLQVTPTFRRRRYQHGFFQAGGLVTLDPFTGARLVSTQSFPFNPLHIAFRFEGLETFFVVIGGIGGTVRFCCIPRLDCLILTPSPGEDAGHKDWSLSLTAI